MNKPELSDKSTTVAFAGDWHGRSDGVEATLQRLSASGVTRLHHVGDFGVFGGGDSRRYLERVNDFAEECRIIVSVTPGNHEDWNLIRSVFANVGPDVPAFIRSHIALLPRGYRWSHAGRTFVSFGGAASIDFEHRRVGSTWFREELPTTEDLEALADGGHADVMITHDSPTPGTEAVNRIRATPGGWSEDAHRYAAHGAEIITTAWTSVNPDLLIHGHFHTQGEVTLPTGQQIVSLAEETEPGNVVLLDLTTMTTTWLADTE